MGLLRKEAQTRADGGDDARLVQADRSEQLRLVAAELQMATIRNGVYIQGADFMAVWKDGKELKGIAYLEAGVKDMLDQLVWWTKALKTARDQEKAAA